MKKLVMISIFVLTYLAIIFTNCEWICSRCFHDNPPGIPICEVCGRSY